MAAADLQSYFPAESSAAVLPPPRRPRPSTPESNFWRSFRKSQLSPSFILPVSSLDFSPTAPHDLAVAASASIHLLDGSSISPKPYSPLSSGFSDLAHSPSFRSDGALLAAGDSSGLVHVLDPSHSRPPLRRLRAHTRAAHVVRFPKSPNDKLHLFSGGDDALLCYWDIPSETSVLSIAGAHKDYIRAGAASPVNTEIFATGSYDHTVKIWDVRVSPESNPVSSFNHGNPVESLLFLPSGGLLATAGGNVVKLWDVIGGGRLIHSMESHNKTVTSLCLEKFGDGSDDEQSRILSVSIDGYLKVFDYAAFKVTHSMRFPAQLLSVGFSPSGSAWVVGASNGTLYFGKKRTEKKEIVASVASEFDGFVAEPQKRALRPSYYRYFHRGQSEKPGEGDLIVKKAAKLKLAEHDKLLKKFRHRESLVSALRRGNPNSIVAVMEELVARKKLLKCVENLDVDELGLLLGFLHKHATTPRYARFLMGLVKKVLEMRAEDVRSSAILRGHVRNLKRMVVEEIQVQRSLQEIQGMISPLLVIAGR
ncbi:protein SLOW WALKER 1 [Dioscorea cayenensis subsp. rotundata]|uniref:Protein SLOW WALKER 1 n=1 Tax=Dioscorea cayennensis subsp. rotundata TaxID=55577 RepID=A0AB40AH70_DIOCR|nr:protein SLOW WALKER 1 [Dioscorea cayenensis subsp. rotundata]